MCKYIKIMKDPKEEINNPLTITDITFNFPFLLTYICKIEKMRDNQRAKFPIEATIFKL